MGPRSDERGNSRSQNPLIVKELQPTARALQSPATNSALFVSILRRKTHGFLTVTAFERVPLNFHHLTARVSLHRAAINSVTPSSLSTAPSCERVGLPTGLRRPGIPQFRLLEREPAVSLEFQANGGSSHDIQKADGSQANPFVVRTNGRTLSFPPALAQPQVLLARNPWESPCAC